jgi:hypothetical protein
VTLEAEGFGLKHKQTSIYERGCRLRSDGSFGRVKATAFSVCLGIIFMALLIVTCAYSSSNVRAVIEPFLPALLLVMILVGLVEHYIILLKEM